MSVVVATPAYEGPLDVLLQLVNQHEVDIFDIPLASVVDAFVAARARGEQQGLQTLSEFLVIAAVLIELKSRRLLPGPDDVDPDEELIGWEERDLLLARLLECQAYAAAADGFAVLMERAARSVARSAGIDDDLATSAPDLLAGVTPDELAAAFLRATAERPAPAVDLYHVTVDAVTVADAVSELERRLPTAGRATFRSLTGHLTTRIEIIVRFLAVLELCKRGRVALDQGTTFGELEVTWVPDHVVLVKVGAAGGDDDDDDYDEYEG